MGSVGTRARACRLGLAWMMATTAIVTLPATRPQAAEAIVQAEQAPAFDIPPQPLAQALQAFARQAGFNVAADTELVAGLSSPGARGRMAPEQALRQLLAGSGLIARPTAQNAVMLERELAPRPLLRLLGGLGVDPASVASNRTLIRTLHRMRVEDPTGVLAYFPQGVTRPGTPGPLAFRAGVIRVAAALAPATVLPVGIRILPGVTPRSEAYVSVGEPLAVPGPGTLSLALLEAAVAEEVEALRAFVARHGESAPHRFPRLPLPLRRAPEQPPLLDDVRGWISRN